MKARTQPMADVGVIVGRFQIHEPHSAHRDLIDTIYNTHKQTIILLGLAPTKVTIENPLDFESRKRMLAKLYPDATILPIKDQPGEPVESNLRWSMELDRIVGEVVSPSQTVCLYGGRESFIQSYITKRFPTQELEPEVMVSATEIRRSITKTVMNSKEFRAGVIWASANRYPAAYPTVDIAILDERTRTNILLVRKSAESKWRLPGGFVDPTDMSYEAAARREVSEELSGLAVTDLQYLGSVRVDDWRYRRERDKIITTLFATTVMFGSPVPSDDVAFAKWFPLTKELKNDIVPEHLPLIELVLEKAARS